MCLRIDGVPSCEKESAEEVLDKVRDLVKEEDVVFPELTTDFELFPALSGGFP